MIPVKQRPLYKQVEDFVRDRIRQGEFGLHSKLPPTDVLAERTGTSVFTVQTALASLCREGLLDRRAGYGTFVKEGRPVLTCAGIYLNRSFSRTDSAFYELLARDLRQKLSAQGVKVRIWSDDRDEEDQVTPIDSLHQSIEKREIQALFPILICRQDLLWLESLPIATAMVTHDLRVRRSVRSNYLQMITDSVRLLKEQGCTSLGVITNLAVDQRDTNSLEIDFFRTLIDFAGQAGLETRNEWIQIAPKEGLNHQSYGHQAFSQIWSNRKKPDGLFVHPDGICSGVITGILQHRVKVPQDLRVVFHANDLIPYPCPLPATFMVSNVGDFADSLIRQIRRQLADEDCTPIELDYSIKDTSPFSQ
jgi:DNA-binding LacI/PurR family transcriptional regulator